MIEQTREEILALCPDKGEVFEMDSPRGALCGFSMTERWPNGNFGLYELVESSVSNEI